MKRLIYALRHPRDYEWFELRPFQHHSRVLLVAGLVYVVFGSVLAFTEPTADRLSGLRFALRIVPLEVLGWTWITVGTLAVLSARWPPASKTWGYTLLSALAACWAAFYLVAWWPLGAPATTLTGTLVWGFVTFMWWAISKLENPDDLLDQVSAHLRTGDVDGEAPR